MSLHRTAMVFRAQCTSDALAADWATRNTGCEIMGVGDTVDCDSRLKGVDFVKEVFIFQNRHVEPRIERGIVFNMPVDTGFVIAQTHNCFGSERFFRTASIVAVHRPPQSLERVVGYINIFFKSSAFE